LQGDRGGAGGEAAMREGNMLLWQVQVLSCGQNTPDSRLTHSPSLHLPGGLNFDPPGSTHCWCSQSSPESSAGNMKQSTLLLKRVNALIAKLGRAHAGSRPMD